MKLFAIGAFAIASLAASSALAQAQGPANPGPVIPGVCVYFNQQALAQSTVGQSVQTRMEQLAQEVQGEIAPYAQQLQTEYQALQAGASTIPADQLNQRRQALQQRAQEAQQLEQKERMAARCCSPSRMFWVTSSPRSTGLRKRVWSSSWGSRPRSWPPVSS